MGGGSSVKIWEAVDMGGCSRKKKKSGTVDMGGGSSMKIWEAVDGSRMKNLGGGGYGRRF